MPLFCGSFFQLFFFVKGRHRDSAVGTRGACRICIQLLETDLPTQSPKGRPKVMGRVPQRTKASKRLGGGSPRPRPPFCVRFCMGSISEPTFILCYSEPTFIQNPNPTAAPKPWGRACWCWRSSTSRGAWSDASRRTPPTRHRAHAHE